jgi:hypothetical protein
MNEMDRIRLEEFRAKPETAKVDRIIA